MLSDLLETVDSFDFEDADCWVVLRSISFVDRAISLDLELRGDGQNGVESSQWHITCPEFVDHRFVKSEEFDITLESNHPVLWRFNESQHQLYFRGEMESAVPLLGSLVIAHTNAVGSAYPIDTFLNSNCELLTLLAGGHGLFAEGPTPLMDVYESVLMDYGLTASRLGERNASYWNGQQWIESKNDWQVLAFGESYVVGKDFEAERVS